MGGEGLRIVRMSAENYKDAAAVASENLKEGWSEQTYLAQLSNPNDRTYIAYFDGEVCGFLSSWYVLGEIEINNIAVNEKFRRRGVAKALFEALFAEHPNAERVVLEVRESNAAAIALYTSLGFECAGRRKRFYTAPDEDALILVLRVESGGI